MTEKQCRRVFSNVYPTLMHIHSRGYLHNDLKGNKQENSEYFPVIIDFGKRRTEDQPDMRRRGRTAANTHIAPEVVDGGRQSTASDVYSLGKIFKGVAAQFQLKFYESSRKIIKKATIRDPIARATVEDIQTDVGVSLSTIRMN